MEHAAATAKCIVRNAHARLCAIANKHGAMNFEPQKFFIGLVDFFSVLLPGAVQPRAGAAAGANSAFASG